MRWKRVLLCIQHRWHVNVFWCNAAHKERSGCLSPPVGASCARLSTTSSYAVRCTWSLQSGPVLMQACRVDVHVVVAELQVNLSGLALLGFRDSYGAEQGHLLAGARKSAPRCAAAWVA